VIPIKDDIPTRTFPILTITLIIINIAVFIYEISLPEDYFMAFINKYALFPLDIVHFNIEPLITHMFLHGGIGHIFGNMLFLWIFGNNVEDALGKFRFLILYVLSGFTAAFLQSFVSILEGSVNIPMVGASGAISGILAAYMKLYPNARILTIIPPFIFFGFVLPAWFFVGYWFIMQVLFALITPTYIGGVAWYAHIGGFIAGWYLTDILYQPKRVKIYYRERL